MRVAVLGAGAFGTALAIALAREGQPVGLWCRSSEGAASMRESRVNARRLDGATLPESVSISAEMADFRAAEALLIAVPMQQISGFLNDHRAALDGRDLIACAKGIDLAALEGPVALFLRACPASVPAVLTGPSFAVDIARGLPTALTLACPDEARAEQLQALLSTAVLRIYRTDDTAGAELGGALKNVIAIAAGAAIGAGLGDSARAALMTRGFAEMNRLAVSCGARPETLAGLSGFGDLVLTCTSAKSRNFAFGQALGAGDVFDRAITVEGAATAKAVTALARRRGIEMPIAAVVAALVDQTITVDEAMTALLSRPLRKE